jgi:uncharacterized protein (DUF1501 family)
MSRINPSRRQFLKHSGALSAAGTMGAPWLMNLAAMAEANAAQVTGYKALVCVFLLGGNDACNTILPVINPKFDKPTDETKMDPSWKRYAAVRSDIGVSWVKEGKTQKVTRADYDDGKTPTPVIRSNIADINSLRYPLHPSLKPLVSLYEAGQLAVVANIGNIVQKTDRPIYALGPSSGKVPPLLRSHNDQQTYWQSGRGTMESRGWGGRFVELEDFRFGTAAAPVPADSFRSVIIGNNNKFSVGDTVSAYGMVSGSGVIPLLPDAPGGKIFGVSPVDSLRKVITGKFKTPRTNLIEQDYAKLVERALDTQAYMSKALSTVTVPAITGTQHKLAKDLQTVAKVIQAHAGGKGRQVFYVSIGSFDTHSGQKDHDKLLLEVAESLAYFQSALGSAEDKVVTFTASDFGRLLPQNGDGSDHGWGGHQFVMGKPVKGGKIYGTVPSYAHDGQDYTDLQMTTDGAMIPSTSILSLAATLGQWFDVPITQLTSSIFEPNKLPETWNLGLL